MQMAGVSTGPTYAESASQHCTRKQINCKGQSCAVGNDAHSSAVRESKKENVHNCYWSYLMTAPSESPTAFLRKKGETFQLPRKFFLDLISVTVI
ncbi:hypothetical protein Zmor_000698 [Zophobas morio]|uniref:Uncharacterized protein n=1 Tax=Zophobas morio TaxID=2755281 RepID=A0AA38J161_9CUCU|nr:hypothetical protein Zmor_000698 [Zophobas morio]